VSDPFSEVPEPATILQFACLRIPFGGPLWSESHGRRTALLLVTRNQDDPFLCEALVGILERFLVDGFKVGQITLMVQSFPELQQPAISDEQAQCIEILPIGHYLGPSSSQSTHQKVHSREA
jgi:hypothetical protein